MRSILLSVVFVASSASAMTQQQMKDKHNYLQQISLRSASTYTAINLADQVVMFHCRQPALLQDLKDIMKTKEFEALSTRVSEKKGIIGINEARAILTKNQTKPICK